MNTDHTTPPFCPDNEYSQSPVQRAEYFAQLEETYKSNGIVVPLYALAFRFVSFIRVTDIASRTYNDPGEGRNFINGTGAVDIYGLVCSLSYTPTSWKQDV